MKWSRLHLLLTVVNSAILLAALVTTFASPTQASQSGEVLRGRGLELVDADGRVRASISILPASVSAAGARSPETVLLRLITERGRPSVKIGASEEAAGLSFAGPTGTRATYVILQAKDSTTSLKLNNEDGRQQVIRP